MALSPFVADPSPEALSAFIAFAKPEGPVQRDIVARIGGELVRHAEAEQHVIRLVDYVLGAEARKVTSIAAEAQLVGVNRFRFREYLDDAASAVFELRLMCTDSMLSFFEGLLDRLYAERNSVATHLRDDETSMVLRKQASAEQATIVGPLAKAEPGPRRKKNPGALETVLVKVMQTFLEMGFSISKAGESPMHFYCEILTSIKDLGQNTGETVYGSQLATYKALPRLETFCSKFPVWYRLTENDRAGGNQRSEQMFVEKQPAK